MRAIVENILGIRGQLNTGRYLGLPSLIGKSKRLVFGFLRERLLRKRLQGWQGKILSQSGKEILIKAVGQAIPSYCMSTFLLPKSLADELQKIMNSFWWGTRADGEGRLNWFRRDRLCDKGEGGIGFRSL